MSIKSIAKTVGVSPSTVSRVLNKPGYKCSVPGLRDKIWKVAMEQNYVPNEAARSLKRGVSEKENKTYYINVLVTRTDATQADPFFAELLRVVESEIHENNCILSKVWYNSFFSNDRKCKTENLDKIISEMYKETEDRNDGLIIIGRCNKHFRFQTGQRKISGSILNGKIFLLYLFILRQSDRLWKGTEI